MVLDFACIRKLAEELDSLSRARTLSLSKFKYLASIWQRDSRRIYVSIRQHTSAYEPRARPSVSTHSIRVRKTIVSSKIHAERSYVHNAVPMSQQLLNFSHFFPVITCDFAQLFSFFFCDYM
jgi:hypothetical protein